MGYQTIILLCGKFGPFQLGDLLQFKNMNIFYGV